MLKNKCIGLPGLGKMSEHPIFFQVREKLGNSYQVREFKTLPNVREKLEVCQK